VAAKGFDEAAREVLPEPRTPAKGRIARERFPKSQPPTDPVLDPWILEATLRLQPGEATGVEMSRSSLYYVVRLQAVRTGRPVSYDEVRGEILDGILRDPPAQQDYVRWMERERSKCRVEYADGAGRKGAKGPP